MCPAFMPSGCRSNDVCHGSSYTPCSSSCSAQNPWITVPCGCSRCGEQHNGGPAVPNGCRNHFDERCQHPCRPHCHGYLLPSILAHGRQHLCRKVAELCVCADAQPCSVPYKLLSVTTDGEQPSWEIIHQPIPHRIQLRVTLPLQCTICDHTGRTMIGRSSIQTDVCLFADTCVPAISSSNLMIVPRIRLLCPVCSSRDLCFHTELELQVDAYLIRWQPCRPYGMDPELCSSMKEIPLYPELYRS